MPSFFFTARSLNKTSRASMHSAPNDQPPCDIAPTKPFSRTFLGLELVTSVSFAEKRSTSRHGSLAACYCPPTVRCSNSQRHEDQHPYLRDCVRGHTVRCDGCLGLDQSSRQPMG